MPKRKYKKPLKVDENVAGALERQADVVIGNNYLVEGEALLEGEAEPKNRGSICDQIPCLRSVISCRGAHGMTLGIMRTSNL